MTGEGHLDVPSLFRRHPAMATGSRPTESMTSPSRWSGAGPEPFATLSFIPPIPPFCVVRLALAKGKVRRRGALVDAVALRCYASPRAGALGAP
jgi:hypothetical protein